MYAIGYGHETQTWLQIKWSKLPKLQRPEAYSTIAHSSGNLFLFQAYAQFFPQPASTVCCAMTGWLFSFCSLCSLVSNLPCTASLPTNANLKFI